MFVEEALEEINSFFQAPPPQGVTSTSRYDFDEIEFLEGIHDDMEEFLDSPEGYYEELQYVRTTHTSKEEAVENKASASSNGNWSSNWFNFYELVEMHGNGLTVRRLPPQPGKKWSTRFLFLDIDNNAQKGHDAPNITKEELEKVLPTMGYELTSVMESTSRKPYKWHIIALLANPIRTSEEYNLAREDADTRLRKAIAALRGVKSLPALVDPKVKWQSSFYGPYQNEKREIVLKHLDPNNGFVTYTEDSPHCERKMNAPEPRLPRTLEENYFKDTRIPLTPSKFCVWLKRTGLSTVERIDDLEYNFRLGGGILPYMRKGKHKLNDQIEKGTRYNTISIFMLKLYAQTRSYNLWLEEHGFGKRKFTDENIVWSFEDYLRKAVEKTDGYDIDKHVKELRSLINKHADKSDREYLESVSMYSSCKKRHRTRSYTSETAGKICDAFLDGEGVVKFDSVEYRDSYLRDQMVSLSTLKKVASKRGLSLSTERKSKGGSREGAGRKSSISFEKLLTKGKVVEGVFHYVGELTRAERTFLSRKGLKVKKTKM